MVVPKSSANPQSCVILVPCNGAIEGGCEDGLRELERRGYTVWRVRGYSAVDAARCQMATDALAAGFEELFWIDSDIVFNPDDVEKLRQHHLPFVCAIYPKKGPRQFAAHYLPGTEKLLFGQNAKLTEILYSGFGFNCTHRSVYEDIQRHCQLPICNLQFPKPLIPYFMPFVHDDGVTGPWYLNEDYAFCERAQQSGVQIFADLSVRLWHVGSYRYSWEEAGSEKERFPNYQFAIGTADQAPAQPKAAPARNGSAPTGRNGTAPAGRNGTAHAGRNGAETVEAPSDGMPRNRLAEPKPVRAAKPSVADKHDEAVSDQVWQKLQSDYPWPEERPPVPPNLTHGWLNLGTKIMLERNLKPDTQLVIEVGSWLGKSTRFILQQSPDARVISIDHWRGSPEHYEDQATLRMLPRLYETFQVNCWESRERLLPLRMPSVDGLRLVGSRGLKPDIVYLDADHSYEAIKADLETSLELFPESTIVGDDWDWDGVREAVTEIANARNLALETDGSGWTITARQPAFA